MIRTAITPRWAMRIVFKGALALDVNRNGQPSTDPRTNRRAGNQAGARILSTF